MKYTKDSHETIYPLSVIIPIHRSNLDIRISLFSLSSNPRLDLQIIVAANSDQEIELDRILSKIPNLPCITLLRIHKARKANAINEALRYVKNKYVLIGDADTLFIHDGINRCLEKLYADETIVAITGIVDPIRKNTLSTIQWFEYRRIFRIFRPFWNLFHANLIISGCAGLFKTESLFRVGLFDCRTLGEDFEITLKLHDYYLRHKIPYKIEYVSTLVAITDTPQTFSALIKQRGRWFAGQLEVVRKYQKILRHPILYRKIILPFLIMILFEVWGTYLKWVLVGICALLSHVTGSSFWKILLLGCSGFMAFEMLLNLCAGRKLKIRNLAFICGFTFLLIILQSVLKDTNPITALKLRKQNQWE